MTIICLFKKGPLNIFTLPICLGFFLKKQKLDPVFDLKIKRRMRALFSCDALDIPGW